MLLEILFVLVIRKKMNFLELNPSLHPVSFIRHVAAIFELRKYLN